MLQLRQASRPDTTAFPSSSELCPAPNFDVVCYAVHAALSSRNRRCGPVLWWRDRVAVTSKVMLCGAGWVCLYLLTHVHDRAALAKREGPMTMLHGETGPPPPKSPGRASRSASDRSCVSFLRLSDSEQMHAGCKIVTTPPQGLLAFADRTRAHAQI